jgi:hypothetical protein
MAINDVAAMLSKKARAPYDAATEIRAVLGC